MDVTDEGFDEEWFNVLSGITQDVVDTLGKDDYPNFRPTLGDLREQGLIADVLPDRATALSATINGNYDRDLHSDFRAVERHVYTYTRGQSFQRQKNIALTAQPGGWYLRIGLGFDVDRSMSKDGVDEFNRFVQVVDEHSEEFDDFVEQIGGHIEPRDGTTRIKEISGKAGVLGASDFFLRPDLHPERHSISWRFFGAKLRFEDP